MHFSWQIFFIIGLPCRVTCLDNINETSAHMMALTGSESRKEVGNFFLLNPHNFIFLMHGIKNIINAIFSLCLEIHVYILFVT